MNMSFKYEMNFNDPVQVVRYLIRDTEAPGYWQDEEIGYELSRKSQPVSEKNVKLVALSMLKRAIIDLASGPSRERSGGYEVYSFSAETLKVLVRDLEKELKKTSSSGISFGGVYRNEVENSRWNSSYIGSQFVEPYPLE